MYNQEQLITVTVGLLVDNMLLHLRCLELLEEIHLDLILTLLREMAITGTLLLPMVVVEVVVVDQEPNPWGTTNGGPGGSGGGGAGQCTGPNAPNYTGGHLVMQMVDIQVLLTRMG